MGLFCTHAEFSGEMIGSMGFMGKYIYIHIYIYRIILVDIYIYIYSHVFLAN